VDNGSSTRRAVLLYEYMKNQAFTLIELLVVVAILSLLSSVIFVNIQESRAKAQDTASVQSLREVKTALVQYVLDFDQFPSVGQVPGSIYTEGDAEFSDFFDELASEGYLSGTTFESQTDQPYRYAVTDGGNMAIVEATLNSASNAPLLSCDLGRITSANLNPSGYLSFYLQKKECVPGGFDFVADSESWYIQGFQPTTGDWDDIEIYGIDQSLDSSNVCQERSNPISFIKYTRQPDGVTCEIDDNPLQANTFGPCPDFSTTLDFGYMAADDGLCNGPTKFCACAPLL